MLVLTEQDYAKVLGQALRRQVKDRPVICIDSVRAEEGDYLDLGRPLMDGVVLPVVVKTLIFGE
jgi:ethanolamine utilization protein EutA